MLRLRTLNRARLHCWECIPWQKTFSKRNRGKKRGRTRVSFDIGVKKKRERTLKLLGGELERNKKAEKKVIFILFVFVLKYCIFLLLGLDVLNALCVDRRCCATPPHTSQQSTTAYTLYKGVGRRAECCEAHMWCSCICARVTQGDQKSFFFSSFRAAAQRQLTSRDEGSRYSSKSQQDEFI